MATSIIRTIGSTGDYTTISAAVGAIDSIVTAETGGLDLVTPDYELRFQLLNEVHTVGTVIEVTCGVTTGANNRIIFEPASGAEHGGQWGVGAIIETTTLDSTLPTIDLHTDFMSMLGCQIRVDHSAGNFRSAFGIAADGCVLSGCLAEGVGSGDYGGFSFVVDGDGSTVGNTIENCAGRGFYCGIGLYIPSVIAQDQNGTIRNCTFQSEVLNVIAAPSSAKFINYEFTNCLALGTVGSNIGTPSLTNFTGSNNYGVANSFPVGLTVLNPTTQTASPPGDWIIYQLETFKLFDVPENDAWLAGVGTNGGAPALDIEGVSRGAAASNPGPWEDGAEALVDLLIDYSDDATPQYIIEVPRAYGIVVQTVPTEIRQLNIDEFRQDLNDLMDDPEGMPYPTNHSHTPPLNISGVTLARVVEILDPYVVRFEDGTYNINVTGGNSNISDKTIKNQVGVNTANSAGLQDPFALQAAAFFNRVSVSTSSAYSGTTFPLGTRGFPVNNFQDALLIAGQRGINQLAVIGTAEIDSGNFENGFIFIGDSQETSEVVLGAGAQVSGCEFNNMTISGVLDGVTVLRDCSVGSVGGYNGLMVHCGITGPIVTSNNGNGEVAEFLDCYSEIPGGGPSAFPYLDFDGAGGADLIIRGWKGGLGIRNQTRNDFVSSLDVESGRITIDSSVTHGDITVRGSAEIFDNSTGSTTVNDKTLEALTAGYVWDEILTGATHNIPSSAGRRLRQANALVAAEAQITTANTVNSFGTDLISDVDEFYVDHTFVFTSGALAGQARIITGYDGTTKRVTFDEDWTSAPAEDDEFIVFADHELTRDQIVEAMLSKLLSDGATFEDTILRVRRHMTNKLITDPVTGVASLYSDDGLTVDESSQMYEDAAGTQTYQGEGAERREGFEDAP